jgi:hypothetical protein
MVPLNAIELLVSRYEGYRLGPTAFALSPAMMTGLDKLPWKIDLDTLQGLPGFWEFENPWGWRNIVAAEWCHHFAFTGQPRKDWDILDFIPVTEERGFDDSWIIGFEYEGGRPSRPAGFSVYHQHHTRFEQIEEQRNLGFFVPEEQFDSEGELVSTTPTKSIRLRRIQASLHQQ